MANIVNAIIISVILLVSIGLLLWGIKRKHPQRMSIAGVLLLFGLFVLLDRFPQYASTFNAWATLLLALAAFIAVAVTIDLERRRRREEQVKDKREREEHLLKEIAEWAANVLKLCSKLTHGFNTQSERTQANDEYLTLKFTGENLKIMAENKKFSDVLLTPLQYATDCFNSLSKDGLQDHNDKRTSLEHNCRTIREEALRLLRI